MGPNNFYKEVEMKYTQDLTQKALDRILVKADPNHARRVQEKSIKFAKVLKLDPADIQLISIAARYHDLGKALIKPGVLNKPDKLSAEERSLIETHPIRSAEILEPFNLDRKGELLDIIRHHHENFNGSGYPDQLKEDEIPYLSRVIFIVDTFDALISPRPYRLNPFTVECALGMMIDLSGNNFDPELLESFTDNIEVILLDNELQSKKIG